MSKRRNARIIGEESIPRCGDYGGPLRCIIALYEDGTEIVFDPSIGKWPLEDLPPSDKTGDANRWPDRAEALITSWTRFLADIPSPYLSNWDRGQIQGKRDCAKELRAILEDLPPSQLADAADGEKCNHHFVRSPLGSFEYCDKCDLIRRR